MKPFKDTPNDFRRILDDTEAKLFLTEHQLLDKLLEFGKQIRPGEPWSARIYYTDHPTHWIIADLYTGFENPGDNGYTIDAIPKSRVTMEQFRSIERRSAAERFPHGIERDETGEVGSSQN